MFSSSADGRDSLEIVIPVWNESENIVPLYRRLAESLAEFGGVWWVTFVDDGSVDTTAARVRELAAGDARVRLLRLSRNFGHAAAIDAGLSRATADGVVVMDGDQQDPPELLPEMIARWRGGQHVVIAHRVARGERGVRGLLLRGFHRFFRYLSDVDIPPNTGTYCLLDRRAVEAINAMPEAHRFFPGLRARAGFRQVLVPFARPDRGAGQPKQSLRRLARYAADAVFSYSFKPLRLLTAAGLVICCGSLALASAFALKRLLGWEAASLGFTTLTCAVLALGGFQLVGMGILGEYLGRVYEEVKRRPSHFAYETRDARGEGTAETRRRAAA